MRERENAIINRLNKTKVEKHPDLKQEKDDRQRELRKRDQSAQLARVCVTWDPFQQFSVDTNSSSRRRKKPESRRRESS